MARVLDSDCKTIGSLSKWEKKAGTQENVEKTESNKMLSTVVCAMTK